VFLGTIADIRAVQLPFLHHGHKQGKLCFNQDNYVSLYYWQSHLPAELGTTAVVGRATCQQSFVLPQSHAT
jgi:hypothetical protein